MKNKNKQWTEGLEEDKHSFSDNLGKRISLLSKSIEILRIGTRLAR